MYRKAFPQDFSGIYLDDAMPQDTPADGARDGRPRGRVTAGEVMERRPAAEDGTRNQRQAPRPRGGAGEHGADPAPEAAGRAPSPGAQPPPPQDGPGKVPTNGAAASSATDPANGGSSSAASTDLEPGEAAEYGTERHARLIGVVRKNLVRFGYPVTKDETDEQRAARLDVTAKLAGVSEIGSSSDLDTGELSKVADTLGRCKNRNALDALLTAGEVDE